MKAGTDHIGIGVGAIIVNDRNEIFLMQRGSGSKNGAGAWAFPGGTVEFGETLAHAVVREIREEFGIEIETVRQLPAFDQILEGERQHWIATSFIARIRSGEPKILEPAKCSDCGWFAASALPSPIAPISRQALDYFLQHLA